MMTKRELFNAKNAGHKIEEGMVIDVVSVGTFPDTDKDGHEVTVVALSGKDGVIYTTISGTIASSISLLEDIIAEDKEVKVKVIKNKSNSGRDFYQLQIV